MYEITECISNQDFQTARKVTQAYMDWLNADLSYQNTDFEFEHFSEMYSQPSGTYLILLADGTKPVGGVGLRRITREICEIKRMYIEEGHRGKGYGKRLLLELLRKAKALGYEKVRLETVPRLEIANGLYTRAGFYSIDGYRNNPDDKVFAMEFDLSTF
jgi:GNAT superfamily N-acetyltransferase